MGIGGYDVVGKMEGGDVGKDGLVFEGGFTWEIGGAFFSLVIY